MFGLKDNDLSFIKETLSTFSSVNEALIYGSRAKGNYKDSSDIDICLKGNISLDILSDINFKLNDQGPLPYVVDLSSYNELDNQALIEHIDRVGIPFYNKVEKS